MDGYLLKSEFFFTFGLVILNDFLIAHHRYSLAEFRTSWHDAATPYLVLVAL